MNIIDKNRPFGIYYDIEIQFWKQIRNRAEYLLRDRIKYRIERDVKNRVTTRIWGEIVRQRHE